MERAHEKRAAGRYIIRGLRQALHEHHGNGLAAFSIKDMNDAIIAGNTRAVVFLHENGCPWECFMVREAIKRNHIYIAQYMLQNGCPWDPLIYVDLIRNGHDIGAIRFFLGLGYACSPLAMTVAAGTGRMDVVKLLAEHRCPYEVYAVYRAEEHGHHDIAAYLRALPYTTEAFFGVSLY